MRSLIRSLYRNLAPPLLQSRLDRRRGLGEEWVYAGLNWREAEARLQPRGWSVDSVIDHYNHAPAFLLNLKAGCPTDLQHFVFLYLVARYVTPLQELSFLDFGGGLGEYRALLQKAYPQVKLRYAIVDTNVMAAAGQSRDQTLQYFETTKATNQVFDFVLASASLQYSLDWRAELADLSRACGKYLLLTRIPVSDGETFLAMQRSYGSEWLTWAWSATELVQEADTNGLQLVDSLTLNPNVTEPSGSSHGFRLAAMLFRVKDATTTSSPYQLSSD